jgi:hypothetical protein
MPTVLGMTGERRKRVGVIAGWSDAERTVVDNLLESSDPRVIPASRPSPLQKTRCR